MNIHDFEIVKRSLTMVLKNSDFLKKTGKDIVYKNLVNDIIACPVISDNGEHMFIRKPLLKSWGIEDTELFAHVLKLLRERYISPLTEGDAENGFRLGGNPRTALLLLQPGKIFGMMRRALEDKDSDSFLVYVPDMESIIFRKSSFQNYVELVREAISTPESGESMFESLSKVPFLLHKDRIEPFNHQGFDPRTVGSLTLWQDNNKIYFLG